MCNIHKCVLKETPLCFSSRTALFVWQLKKQEIMKRKWFLPLGSMEHYVPLFRRHTNAVDLIVRSVVDIRLLFIFYSPNLCTLV